MSEKVAPCRVDRKVQKENNTEWLKCHLSIPLESLTFVNISFIQEVL